MLMVGSIAANVPTASRCLTIKNAQKQGARLPVSAGQALAVLGIAHKVNL
jgi:hypothetical protein